MQSLDGRDGRCVGRSRLEMATLRVTAGPEGEHWRGGTPHRLAPTDGGPAQ